VQARAVVGRQLMGAAARERIGEAGYPPAQGLAVEDEQIDRDRARWPNAPPGSRMSGTPIGCREIARPQPDIEARMLEPRKPAMQNGPTRLRPSGQQEQRPTGGIEADHDERHDTVAGTDMALPGSQKVEALVRGSPRRRRPRAHARTAPRRAISSNTSTRAIRPTQGR